MDQVRAGYVNLMATVHPDHGGLGYLAKKLNSAKVLLTGQGVLRRFYAAR